MRTPFSLPCFFLSFSFSFAFPLPLPFVSFPFPALFLSFCLAPSFFLSFASPYFVFFPFSFSFLSFPLPRDRMRAQGHATATPARQTSHQATTKAHHATRFAHRATKQRPQKRTQFQPPIGTAPKRPAKPDSRLASKTHATNTQPVPAMQTQRPVLAPLLLTLGAATTGISEPLAVSCPFSYLSLAALQSCSYLSFQLPIRSFPWRYSSSTVKCFFLPRAIASSNSMSCHAWLHVLRASASQTLCEVVFVVPFYFARAP